MDSIAPAATLMWFSHDSSGRTFCDDGDGMTCCMNRVNIMNAGLAFLFVLLMSTTVSAADWPTYRGDNTRSGYTATPLARTLHLQWTHRPLHGPRPAWPAPAHRDVLNQHDKLDARNVDDHAFHPVAVGDRVLFGSSSEDRIVCLDARTGEVQWVFFTSGPVRYAPAVWDERVLFGSDDGYVYCVRLDNGSLLWKHRVGPVSQHLPGNERMISQWPVRTGVAVEDGIAYAIGGFFPSYGVYACALRIEDGSVVWKEQLSGVSPQGYLLLSPQHVYSPTGRTSPFSLDRNTGKIARQYNSVGGTFALLAGDTLLTGRGNDGRVEAIDTATRDRLISFAGRHMVVTPEQSFMLSETHLQVLDRVRYLELTRQINTLQQRRRQLEDKLKKAAGDDATASEVRREITQVSRDLDAATQARKECMRVNVPTTHTLSLAVAGDIIVCGGNGEVALYDVSSGERLWTAPVEGKALGLAIAGGRLIVSTDQGVLHCFGNAPVDQPRVVQQRPNEAPDATDTLSDAYREAAEAIVASLDTQQGYCLVLDADEGRLAHELARRTRMHIVGIESDERKLAVARQRLAKAGLYGARVTLYHGSLADLAFPDYFANLIVRDGSLSSDLPRESADQIYRALRPCGGKLMLSITGENAAELKKWGGNAIDGLTVTTSGRFTWASATRSALEGEGEWTHTYSGPDNTASSGDRLIEGPMRMQWFGQPGPSRMVDRHFRNVPPLYKAGRLFIPGNEVIFAVDAYNGTILWEAEIPESLRIGSFLDASNMVLDDAYLNVVKDDHCIALDVRTGKSHVRWRMPQLDTDVTREWGYIALSDGMLVGSGRPRGATYRDISRHAQLVTQAMWYPNMKLAVSEYVFGFPTDNPDKRWTYRSGRIIDTTLTIGAGRVYFIETHSPAALANKDGRLSMLEMVEAGDQFLVALDLKTGQVLYRQKIDIRHVQQPCYLAYRDEVLLLSGSQIVNGEHIRVSGLPALEQRKGNEKVRYHLLAFDARDGSRKWQISEDTNLATRGGHGEYNRRPTIIRDTAYFVVYAYNIHTGERLAGWEFNHNRNGCGGVTGCESSLFWRASNPIMYRLGAGGGPQKLTTITRPGCWINIIPAGGLVLVPEASSGCTCAYPVQTSIAFAPVR